MAAPDLVGDACAEGGAEAFLFRPLHEDEEDEEQADCHEDDGHEDNEDAQHKGREFEWDGGVVKRAFPAGGFVPRAGELGKKGAAVRRTGGVGGRTAARETRVRRGSIR